MIFSAIRRFFAAAPHRPELPPSEVKRLYPWYRWQILEATFIGYATFYLVRNNLSPVTKDMAGVLHYDTDMIGTIMAATAVSYGVGKFFMGALSDRCNPRTFMATGLMLTALCNFAFGWVTSYPLHLALWSLNGLFQGMGWPPCGRSMGHWFSEKERGLTFSIWNTSHNVGGALAGLLAVYAVEHFGGWQHAFYVPGILAAIGAIYLLWRLRDTPQSVGLPPIEEYKRDYGSALSASVRQDPPRREGQNDNVLDYASAPVGPLSVERELTTRELFIDNVLAHPWIWLLAIANFFAYVARYSMLDWGPMYLREVKGADLLQGGWAVFWIEIGGIGSTIVLGWLSDLAGGRRGMVAVLCMLPILVAFGGILFTPAGQLWVAFTMLGIIGLFIYPVINFIVIMALDLTSKKAIGTAAGFIGLFGYLGRMAYAKGTGWMLAWLEPLYGKNTAWDIVIYATLGCAALAMFFLAFTWRLKPRS
ncbi:MAG TPA: MFS transporter [Phycisphaerae bacterium]|nr:MFS transporter [Phycisphaerae bacterium]HOJ53262.1 MFS transporter [Phycisphaerae bacterium]HOL25226.1 MFS transporter [Phycisphaerae bacterium]HPP20220.1 MFS transporter [Phycisphaerae bacterium]HPU32277.1 MFS transporter [Phycisphaerae bacterium]